MSETLRLTVRAVLLAVGVAAGGYAFGTPDTQLASAILSGLCLTIYTGIKP